jgi:pimeloyl-ACP methyl ester carboxylesterase
MNPKSTMPMMQAEVTGQGEPLVLVPGGLTGWLSWIPHAKHWSDSRRVVRLQLCSVELGLSDSTLPDGYGVEYEIEALHNSLTALGITSADFAAWSYGAAVTLSFALRNPDYVRSLTLIEPPAFWVLRTRAALSDQLLGDQKQMQLLAIDEVSEDQLIWFTRFAGFVPANSDPRSLPAWPVWSQHRQSLRIGDAPFRYEDSLERVRNFQKPVLLIKGQGSSDYYHEIIDGLAATFPNARVETLPSGHAAHIVSIERFLELFDHFTSQIK